MYFVYILQSRTTGRFYIGSTDHLLRRFSQHQNGYSPATRNRGPWWMPYYEIFDTNEEAVQRELEIKAKKSAKSVHRIIHFNLPGLDLE